MSKNKKHDSHTELRPVVSKNGMTVGDYVMIKPDLGEAQAPKATVPGTVLDGLTRETYGTSIGLLCEIIPITETNLTFQGKVLFAGQLITLNLDLLQLRNY